MLQQLAATVDKLLFANLNVVESSCVNRLFRLTWLVAVALSFGGLAFYSSQAYDKWHTAPDISVAVEQTPSRVIPFPAITVCLPALPESADFDQNPREYLDKVRRGLITSNLSQEQQNVMALVVHTCYPHLASPETEQVYRNRSEARVVRLFERATFRVKLLKCQLRDITYPCEELFTPSLTDFGICHSFNLQDLKSLLNEHALINDLTYNVSSSNTTWTLGKSYSVPFDNVFPARAMKINRINFQVKLESQAMFCETIGRGIKLYVHMPNEVPTPFHESQFVEIGFEKFFKVSAKIHTLSKSMHGYPPEIRGCYFESEKRLRFFKSYTKALCEFECMTNYTLEHCGCVKFNMPRSNDTKVCDFDKIACYNEAVTSWPIVSGEHSMASKCNCLPPCTDISYNLYVEQDNRKLPKTLQELLEFGFYATSFEASFTGHVVEKHTRYVTYTIQNLVADVGGLIGLFLGFSLLSIFELCSGIIGICVNSVKIRTSIVESKLVRYVLKLIWAIVALLLFGGFLFYASGAFRKLRIDPDISIKMEQIPSRDIPLPAMTICHSIMSTNTFKLATRFKKLFTKPLQGNQTKLTVEEQSKFAGMAHTCFLNSAEQIDGNLYANRNETNVVKILLKAESSVDFSGCVFAGENLDECSAFLEPSLNDEGICKTFNSQGYRAILSDDSSDDFNKFKIRSISRSPDYMNPLYHIIMNGSESLNWTLKSGYTTDRVDVLPIRATSANIISIYMIQENTISHNCKDVAEGFTFYFHLPNEIVTPFHEHQFMAIKQENHFTINAIKHVTSEKMRDYRPETRGCYFDGEKQLKLFKTYTKSLCDYECMINYTLQECGCVKFNMPRLNDTKVCDIDKIPCYRDIKRFWPVFGDGSDDVSKGCKCLKSCTNIEYIVDVESSGRLIYTGAIASYISSRFFSHTVDQLISYNAYTLQNWVSDVGGLIGLFLGLSLLSIFELINSIVETLLKIRKKKTKVDDVAQDSGASSGTIEVGRSRVTKVSLTLLWILAVILSFLGLLFYTYEAYSKWHIAPDITTSVRDVPSRDIPLPAVTMCSTSFPAELTTFYHPALILDKINAATLNPYLTAEEQNYMAVMVQTCYPIRYEYAARKACKNRTETDIVKLLKQATYLTKFTNCRLRDVSFECDRALQETLTDHGLCHTINIQSYEAIFNEGTLSSDFGIFKSNITTTDLFGSNSSVMMNDIQWTPKEGYKNDQDIVLPIRARKQNAILLEKTLPMNRISYYCVQMSSGYKLFFHLPNEVPTLLHKTNFLKQHRVKALRINAKVHKLSKELHEYPPEIRRCYLEGERKLAFFKTYTKTLCDYECLTNYTLRQCGCVKFSMPRTPDTKVCDLNKLECFIESAANWVNKASKACNCLQSCTGIEYGIEVEKEYFYDENKPGIAQLMLSFGKHTAEEHTRYVAYGVQNFIADSGGLLGLFLGFSLLSIFELVCNLVTFCLRKPVLYGIAGGFGITAGAHRLWAHNSYKTNTAMKVMLLFFQTIAFQNSAYEWTRDHRVHHKFTDTNADPHNARRGFFFSHMGWLLCKKHPDVKKFGVRVSMADLEADPIIMFQHRHYIKLMLLCSVFLPVFIPWYFWNESFLSSFFMAGVFRYITSLHITWLINSAAHTYGMKPFDRNISPADSYLVGFLALGEGWHNYHHVFPYDYKTSELGFYLFNLTTGFIDFFSKIGWAYDLKTVSAEMIRRRVLRTGDGSHPAAQNMSTKELLEKFIMTQSIDSNGNVVHKEEDSIWGFDDEMLNADDRKYVKIINQHSS